jgi:UDP-glucose 4-epimerase
VAKCSVEHYLDYFSATFGLEAVALRYANVYGPRQDPHGEAGVVAIFALRLRQGLPLRINARHHTGDDGCVRDYVFVGDVVRAHRVAAQGLIDGEILDVGTGEGTTTRALALAIARAMDTTAVLEPAPPRAGDVERSVLDPAGLRARVGEPLPLAEGLARTVGALAGASSA